MQLGIKPRVAFFLYSNLISRFQGQRFNVLLKRPCVKFHLILNESLN